MCFREATPLNLDDPRARSDRLAGLSNSRLGWIWSCIPVHSPLSAACSTPWGGLRGDLSFPGYEIA
jgi:hypothetical protein